MELDSRGRRADRQASPPRQSRVDPLPHGPTLTSRSCVMPDSERDHRTSVRGSMVRGPISVPWRRHYYQDTDAHFSPRNISPWPGSRPEGHARVREGRVTARRVMGEQAAWSGLNPGVCVRICRVNRGFVRAGGGASMCSPCAPDAEIPVERGPSDALIWRCCVSR